MSSQDEGQRARPVAPSTVHDLVTGGIEGAASSIAVDPLIQRIEKGAFQNPLRPGWGKRALLYGAAGTAATGLIGALVSMTSRKHQTRRATRSSPLDMEARNLGPDMIELASGSGKDFDDKVPRAKPKLRKVATAAGVGALALGATTLPGASKFFGIRGRMAAKGLGFAGNNEGGKMVADYIEGAQKLLNTGIKGKVAGAAIQESLRNPGGKVSKVLSKTVGSGDVGQRLATEHYARFRSSPLEALKFWDYEHGLTREAKVESRVASAAERGASLSPRMKAFHQRQQDEMHYGREKAHSAIKEQIEVHGKSEMEALKHVAYNNSDPQVQNYFNQLAQHKAKASGLYAKYSLTSPALIAAGTGGVVYGRKKNQTPRQAVHSVVTKGLPVTGLERIIEVAGGLTELDAYDPMSDRQLRAGVRLDKYQKTIRAREIDRHIHDYLRSSAIGAVAGAAIPGPGSLKARSLAGAGAGIAVAGVLHAAGHRDAYGEQTEEAKILQRNAPKYVGAAAVLGGLLARRRLAAAGRTLRVA